MAGAKSLVVLCCLLIIATSQAAPCSHNSCYRCCIGYRPKPYCASKCHCSSPSTFFPNELATKEALAAAEMEVDYNRAETALDKMIIEELTSMNEVLAAKPKCQYNPCYRYCIRYRPKPYCASNCHCSLSSTFFPNELATKEAVLEEMMMAEGTDAKVVDVAASTSTE